MGKPNIAIAAFASLLLSGCPWSDDSGSASSVATPKSALAQSAFSDCDDYRHYYARALAREYLDAHERCWGCDVARPMGAGAPGPAEGTAVADANAGAPATFAVSQTNTQEAGVDEDDVLEADPDTGRFYLLRGYDERELVTVDAVPAESMSITSRIATGDNFANGLYLDAPNDRLAAVTNLSAYMMWDVAAGHFSYGSTQLLFYDLADPDHPALTDRYEISGYLLGSRRVGSRVHLVTSSPAGLPGALAQDGSFWELLQRYYQARYEDRRIAAERLADEIRARIRAAVDAAPLDELLPVWRQGLDSVTAPQPLACSDVYHAHLDKRLGLITISSIDTDGTGLAHMATINNAWQLYSSPTHLYLTQGSGGWWWDPDQRQQTAIYRYAIGASGPATPAGHGLVDGWLRNSYGLSEHEGYLRTATTEARRTDEGWRRSNHLFVLDDGLEEAGAVRDFVRDETIFASRFLGDRGYVVTFELIDPLFTFDLSQPTAPKLAGELEVPGVSTYLHPFGADHLVTIGRAAVPNFWAGAIQLQLFDVSTLESPALVDDALLGEEGQWAWSVAQYEPHAFTLFGDVLSVPAEIGAEDYTQAFSGFVAYRVAAPGGFTELGRIDHKQADDGSGGGCPTTSDDSDAPCASFAPVIYNPPLRSVLVEEADRTVLYTLSNAFLKAHVVTESLEEVASVPLKPAE